MEKLKKIKVNTSNGVDYLVFKPIVDAEPTELICETRCPYGKICEKIKDPTHPDNPDYSFMDFCGALGGDEVEELSEKEAELYDRLIPIEGTIEKVLGLENKDLFQDILSKDPVVKVSEVIDCVCSDGFCDDYTEDHSKCSASNYTCILKKILMNKNKKNAGE